MLKFYIWATVEFETYLSSKSLLLSSDSFSYSCCGSGGALSVFPWCVVAPSLRPLLALNILLLAPPTDLCLNRTWFEIVTKNKRLLLEGATRWRLDDSVRSANMTITCFRRFHQHRLRSVPYASLPVQAKRNCKSLLDRMWLCKRKQNRQLLKWGYLFEDDREDSVE